MGAHGWVAGIASHGSVSLSRGWLISVEAPRQPGHLSSIQLDAVVNLHFRVNSLFHYLCSQCYAAQHSYVPILSLRRDSPSKIVPDFLCATS